MSEKDWEDYVKIHNEFVDDVVKIDEEKLKEMECILKLINI